MATGMTGRRLAADTIVTQSGRVLQIIFSILTVVVLARALGAADFGIFSTIVAVQAAVFAFADLGLGQLAVRAVAQLRQGQVSAIRAALPHLYAACSVVAVGTTVLSLALLGVTSETAVISLLLGLSYVYSPARAAVERGFWLGALRFGRATVIDVIIAGFRMLAVTATWLAGGASLLSFAVGLGLAGTATILVVRLWLTYPNTRSGDSEVPPKALLLEAAPFALSSLVWNSFTELPKVLLAPIAGVVMVGQFAAASRFLTAAYVPLQSLTLVMTPRLFALAGRTGSRAETSHTVVKAVAYTTLAGVLLAIALVVLSPALPILLGDDFEPAVPVLRVLAVSLPFQAVAFMAGDWLGGAGRQMLRFWLILGLVLAGIPVLALAARASGATGVAVAYSGLTAAVALVTVLACRRVAHG